jgi:hypothetical protein
MKIFNLLEACSIVGDAMALRMALASNRETMSSFLEEEGIKHEFSSPYTP